jgi:2',3'-cyclic-nucleotide 2'-phosphodiesterase (5'-nucleotidase family)
LIVEAGNFAAKKGDAEFSPRKKLVVDFFQEQGYDAVALGQDELTSPLSEWIAAADSGLPLVAANLYQSRKSSKPLFEPYRIVERNGLTMAVVGLVPERAVTTSPDSSTVRVGSPYQMKKLFKKLAKKADMISIIGDFTPQEAESLAKCYPGIDLILSPNAQAAKPVHHGNVTVMGCGSKGYFGDYVDLDFAAHDSTSARTVRETLDQAIPADTVYEHRVAAAQIKPRK